MKKIALHFYLEVTSSRDAHRLYARLSLMGTRKKIYSQFLVPEACWIKDEYRTIARSNKKEFADKPRFFSKTAQANAWIELITSKVDEINDRIARQEDFTLEQVMDFMTGKTSDLIVPIESELTMHEFFRRGLENHVYLRKIAGKALSPNTISNYTWYYNRYISFIGEKTLMKDFDQKMLDKSTYRLIEDASMCNTSIRSMYSALKAMMDKGKMLQLMPKSYNYPVFPHIKDSEYQLKTRLTVAEIEKLKTLDCHNKTQQQAIDAFLIAFYGCGMRMSEVLLLRMKHINPHMKIFNYYAQKTNETVPYYQMSDDFWEITSKYYQKSVNPETFLLPIMRPFSKLKTRQNAEGTLEKQIKYAEKKFNYWYKKISEVLMLPDTFTGHSARKSFALALYEATGDVLKVKEYLNHKKIDTTMVYLSKNGVKSIMHKNENIDIFEAFKELAKKEIPAQAIRKIN